MTDLPEYRREEPSAQPPALHAAYASTVKRAPQQQPIRLPHTLSEITGPQWDRSILRPSDDDLTRRHQGAPLGERIIVAGRVLDEAGRPIPNTLIEIWQANAAGRYVHHVDQHAAPLAPNFFGGGRCVTDDNGRYRFTTVKPGAYPWQNHHNAWRPNHIHFSLFGPTIATRLVTQMYFPGDSLMALDPIFLSTPERARGEASHLIAASETTVLVTASAAVAETLDPHADLARAARLHGYEGDSCAECGNFTLVRNGTCLKCLTCGATTGCDPSREPNARKVRFPASSKPAAPVRRLSRSRFNAATELPEGSAPS